MNDSAIPLTLEQFRLATGSTQHNAEKYYPFIQGACKAFGITTRLRLAAFLAQIGHESSSLTRVVENLNYSAQGLMSTWPSRFKTLESALPYHRNPEKIANKVYANRMGNGNEASGDGWRYRGRGTKQITGKDNYRAISKAFGVDFVSQPELLEHPVWAALSAAWFWHVNNLNHLADKGDIASVTKKINGGYIGLEDRQKRYKAALVALQGYSYEG